MNRKGRRPVLSERKRIHVTPDGDRWKAEWEGADRASAIGETQSEVEQRAKEIARNSGGAEVVIHRPDGTIRDSDTIGRPDPNPPKDTKH
jgi:hypothetical protein